MFGSYTQLRQIQYRQVFGQVHLLILHPIDNHTYSTGIVGYRVYQDERTGSLILPIRVKEKLFGSGQHHARNLIELHRQCFLAQLSVVNGKMLHRIDIHFILDAVDAGTAYIGGLFDEE